MQLVNILLSMGLIVLVIGITVLSACTLEATSGGINVLGKKSIGQLSLLDRRKMDRRSQNDCSFPFSCKDGTTINTDRRRNLERRSSFSA